MASMDIFTNDAFRTRELSDAIDNVPIQWGRIGELGLFPEKPIRTANFSVESRNGVLSLIQSTERGTPLPGAASRKRQLRDFRTRRFGQSARITADDVDGIRAFGEETELMQVQDEVNDRLVELGANCDITIEYLRAGALRGDVRDADGSLITNLFGEFGIAETVVNFDLGTAGSDVDQKCRDVSRHIETNLLGDTMTSVHALCHKDYMDELLSHDTVRESYRYYTSVVEPLREDARKRFPHQGIMFEEYLGEAGVPQEDGTVTVQEFIPAGEARFFPMGTMSTFNTYVSPADYLDTVNTPGQLKYAAMAPDERFNRFVEIEAQTNPLPMCKRPAVLVRGTAA